MIVALGFCHKDYLAAEKLFRWMAELDGQQQNHSLLLMAAKAMKMEQIKLVEQAAATAFHAVFSRMTRKADERGWPVSSNTLFLTAYHEIRRMGGSPFLWIEPDCVPLKPKWIDSLLGEYLGVGKPFMGCVYDCPWPHLTGCAIYPPEIEKYSPGILKCGLRAWDMVDTDSTIANAHHSGQYQHEWGNFKYNIAPTFPNQASLGIIRPEAVLFHRCKDGSLIDRLRDRKRWPKLCKTMARYGKPGNHFQDFEDSHSPAGRYVST
jgi:hypothetical protein